MKNEQQLAREIAHLLDSGIQTIDENTAAQLAEARRRAVSSMTQHKRVASLQPVLAGWGRVAEFSEHAGYRFWLPVLILLAMVIAVLGSSLMTPGSQPIDADALLLASDLPPEAYADKEFVSWLEHSQQL